MSLLREIKIDATRSDVRVADLLRKCLLLAWQLKSTDFEQWVDFELTGYPEDGTNVPSYRTMERNRFFANLYNGHRHGNNIPVSINIIAEVFPNSYKKIVGPFPCTQSVAELENGVLHSFSNNHGGFMIPWNADMARELDDKIAVGFMCLQVWCVIPTQAIINILDNIKTRIMKFVNALEKENPDAGEASRDETPIPLQTVTQVFNQYFYGTVSNLATGSSHFQQSVIPRLIEDAASKEINTK